MNIVGLDTEYFGHEGKIHRPGGTLACVSVAAEGLKRTDSLLVDPTDIKLYLRHLKKTGATIAMQNASYDIRQLKASGLWPSPWKPEIHDTMLVEQALFGGWYQLNSLQDLSRRWLKRYLSKDTVSQFPTSTKLTPAMRKYALDDAAVTRDIAIAQMQYVDDEHDGDFNWYEDIDLQAMWAVLDMAPIRMDVDGWLSHSQALYAEGNRIQQSLGFNVKSAQQVKKALIAEGIKVRGTTDADFMAAALEDAQLKGQHKQENLLKLIMRARKCRDAMSKYGANWIDKNVEDGEWVYPNWNVTGAETGRMSCSKPNMQNIPKRGAGSIYRSFFLATVGQKLLIGDVVQQEPRFSAFLSKDSTLTDEILQNIDLHQRTADLFGLSGADARPRGKAINLGLNYGMSAHGLAARVGISVQDAQAGVDARRRHYSRYYAWQDKQARLAERRQRVATVTGRPVWVNPYNFQYRRNAINGPIQGSAADQTKLALAYVRQQCESEGVPFTVNLVIHDEIGIDVPKGMMSQYRKILENAWKEAGHKLMPTIPTEVDMASGYNWKVHE